MHLGDRSRLLRPQRRRRRGDGRGGAGQGRRPAGARAIHARPGHRLGPQGPGLDPQGARRDRRRPARSSPTSSSARRSRASTCNTNGSKPLGHAGGTGARRAAEVRRQFRRAGGIVRLRQQAHGLGDDRAAARPLLAAAHLASARPGRPANSLRQRIVHRRGCGGAQPRPDRVPAAPRQGPARHRRHQGRGREGRLAVAAIAAQGPDRQQGRGRGIAYAQRNGTRVAIVAEVEVDRSTGKIWARKFTVAHDCGQIINPDGLVKTIEGNIVQGISRTLWEEVKFDNKNVTSVDWMTYPILDITETPAMRRRRADQPAGACADRRRRAVDPAGGGGDRQRHLRRNRRAHPPGAVLAGSREAGAVVVAAKNNSAKARRNAGPFSFGCSANAGDDTGRSSPPLNLSSPPDSRCVADHVGDRRLVARRHDVHAGNAGDGRQAPASDPGKAAGPPRPDRSPPPGARSSRRG